MIIKTRQANGHRTFFSLRSRTQETVKTFYSIRGNYPYFSLRVPAAINWTLSSNPIHAQTARKLCNSFKFFPVPKEYDFFIEEHVHRSCYQNVL
jgi:hypothetical protein